MNKYERISKIILVAVFLLLTACSSSSISHKSQTAESTVPADDNTYGNGVGSGSGNGARSNNRGGGGGGGGEREEPNVITSQVSLPQAEQSQNTAVTERKIIRNADIELEADAPQETQQKIAQIVGNKGGFVVESTQSNGDAKAKTRETVTMTARVPAAKFEESLTEIRQTASRVIVETVKGEDVTEEFIDIEARLKTQKALEAQFLEIMKQAKTVEDALKVQSKLADVRGEIEKIEGRKKFLENQASFSTVKIRLQTPAAFAENSEGFFYRLRESVGSGFEFAVDFVLALVAFLVGILPFFLLIVLPVYLVIRYLWKRRRRQKNVEEIAREEIRND